MSPYQLITVTITATNGAGTSEPSNEVSGRTHEAGMIMNILILFSYHNNYCTAPGRVEIVDIVTVSDTTSTVLWNPPIQPNGIITGYEVIYSVYENVTNISIPITGNVESFNITDLCKLSAKLRIHYKGN